MQVDRRNDLSRTGLCHFDYRSSSQIAANLVPSVSGGAAPQTRLNVWYYEPIKCNIGVHNHLVRNRYATLTNTRSKL